MTQPQFWTIFTAMWSIPLVMQLVFWRRNRKAHKTVMETNMSNFDFERFERKAKERGLDKSQPPLKWYFVSYVKKDSGAFFGACLLQGESRFGAADDAFRTKVSPESNGAASFDDVVEVPDHKLPAEEYRNRLLTLDEVRSFWPWVKA